MKVFKDGNQIITGTRNFQDGLWDVKLPQHPPLSTPALHIVIKKDKKLQDLIHYYQACCFHPRKSTFIKAIKNGNFIKWPGLTAAAVSKYYVSTEASAKGHLNQERKFLQSTKHHIEIDDEDFFPSKEPLQSPTHECMAIILPFEAKNTSYGDLTGRFPHLSSQGNKYILVVYDYDSNAILAEPLQSRQGFHIKQAYNKIITFLASRGAKPNVFILDNEISGELKQAIMSHDIKYQLVPPHVHRRNAAERGIQTFKHHFIAGLATTDPDFPMSEWDRLLDQGLLSLNLLRNARLNPKLSAQAFLNGFFDLNKTPLAPPGTKVIIHEKPTQRTSWGPHGVVGWYVGPATEHYRCVRVYVPSTFRERISDTVEFLPHKTPFPTTSDADTLVQATDDILSILARPTPLLPFLQANTNLRSAIASTAVLLNRAIRRPPSLQKTIETIQPSQNPVSLPRVKEPLSQSPRVGPVKTTTKFAPILSHLPVGTNFKALQVDSLIANVFFQPKLYHIYNKDTGKRETPESLLNGDDKEIWIKAVSNELGRLAKGNKYGVSFTETIEFICKNQVPLNRNVTYASMVFDHRPLKTEKYRCRIVAGGDRLTYDEDASSPATDILETKLLLNSIISDAKNNARFISADLKDFFLASPMHQPEYMKMHIKYIPKDIIDKYTLNDLVFRDYVYIRINKGMYGLKQAALLAYQQLRKFLEPAGYIPIPNTVGMWKHKTRKTIFCLCVDDFGIKSYNDDDVTHLLTTLKQHYVVSIDWEGKHFCGLTMNWNYEQGYVDISIPGYVEKVLHKYQHSPPIKPEYSPHAHTEPIYGAKQQFAQIDDSPPVDAKATKRIQGIIGSLLYYARTIDNTMLTAINEISAVQAKPTQKTLAAVTKLLDYASTYSDSIIRFYASNMTLFVESDAAYLVQPNARSRISGYFYLSNKHIPHSYPSPKPNGPILIICKTIRHVVASAAEAETAGLFYNARESIPIRQTLIAMGHPQPPTPIKTDNTTAYNFVTSNLKQKKSKSWDMRLNWLRDRKEQTQFFYYWEPGNRNIADYHTKHHAPKYHLQQRHRYVYVPKHQPTMMFLTRVFSQAARVCSYPGVSRVIQTPLLTWQGAVKGH